MNKYNKELNQQKVWEELKALLISTGSVLLTDYIMSKKAKRDSHPSLMNTSNNRMA